MKKLSIRHVKSIKLSRRASKSEEQLVEEMRACVKKDPAVRKKFEEYKVPIDALDSVHIEFDDLDVSAKTKDKKIYLNRGLIGEQDDLTHYVAHEIIHFLQQHTGQTHGHHAEDNYLDKTTEIESYQVQTDFKERHESPAEADRYIEGLLDYHKVKDPEERAEKKDELMGE